MLKKYLVVIALTLITSIVISKVHSIEALKNEKLFTFPLKIGQWSAKEIPMENWVFESLETPYAILRDYYSPNGDKVNLAIVWYDDKEVAFHAPEACLGGVGNKVKEKTDYQLRIDNSKNYRIGELHVERNNQKFLVLYYFISDGYVTQKQVELRTRILLRRLTMNRTSAALIRLMMPVGKDHRHARVTLQAFLKGTSALINEYTKTEKKS